jgi:hypothetical protein
MRSNQRFQPTLAKPRAATHVVMPENQSSKSMVAYYEPWEGQFFRTQPYEDVRLLLVGESSYKPAPDVDSNPDHLRVDTQEVVNGTLKPKRSWFWRFIQRSVAGKQELDAWSQGEFWNRVALVNLIQRPMSCKNSRPCHSDYLSGSHALTSYVRFLEPDVVILYSKEGWSSVQQAFSLSISGTRLVAEELIPATLASSNVCWTSAQLGSASPMFLLVRHPSARPRLSGLSLHRLVASLLARVRHNKAMHAPALCAQHRRNGSLSTKN